MALGIDPHEYRIICRNGSLAANTGFDVDPACALTTIVDGEIVVARNNHKTTGVINALISFDKYFQTDPDFKMFNAFGGKRDLLFKVSNQYDAADLPNYIDSMCHLTVSFTGLYVGFGVSHRREFGLSSRKLQKIIREFGSMRPRAFDNHHSNVIHTLIHFLIVLLTFHRTIFVKLIENTQHLSVSRVVMP